MSEDADNTEPGPTGPAESTGPVDAPESEPRSEPASESPSEPEPESTPDGPRPRRRGRVLLLAGLAAVVVAAVVAAGVVIAGDDDEDDASSPTAQVAAMQQACHDWMRSEQFDGPRPDGAWCDGMGAWMHDQVRQGHMMGPMTPDQPERLRDACHAWMTEGAPDGAGEHAWCDDMAGWMAEHHEAWDDD